MKPRGTPKSPRMPGPKGWEVEFHDLFDREFDELGRDVQDGLLAAASALEQLGPGAGRPYVDTLKESRHGNMKELRFTTNNGREQWRAAFAFDPERRAIILVAGAKQGKSSKLFYRQLISKADERYDAHLARVGKKR